MTRARWLVWLGALVLVGTAVYHGFGYPYVVNAIRASGAKPSLVSVMEALWLMFSAHLIILSLIAISASRNSAGKRLVLLCALMPVIDTLLLIKFVGFFVGTWSLAAAAILLIVGATLLPKGGHAGSQA